MKTRIWLITVLLFLFTGLCAQTKTGTLKVFTDLTGVSVFLDEVKQDNYKEISEITVGTHYLKVLNNAGEKIYGNIVTINENAVTTVLVEPGNQGQAAQGQKPVEEKTSVKAQDNARTGTLNIFSELTGISVYLDENKQGEDLKTVQGVPVGSHYLKILKDGVSVFGELITINEGQTTTVLVKNNGQVAEKIMEGKVKERQDYKNEKIDVLITSNSISQTRGTNTLFPGYYGYWGYSNSVTSTTQIADFKIVQGGVKEIGDLALASLTNNKAILDRNARDNVRIKKMVNVGAPMLLAGTISTLIFLADFMLDKPFLHSSPEHPDWEVYAGTASIVTGVIGYGILNASEKVIPHHYYNVDEAAREAQQYNNQLKDKYGLPQGYDVDK